jgi:hypothetical protein
VSRRVVGLVLVCSLFAGGCGLGGSDGEAGAHVQALEADRLPTELLGMTTRREDVGAALAQFRPAYAEAAALYSFRTDDLVQATLQIARFLPTERYRSPEFQRTVVNQLGTSAPQTSVMGSRTVYRTSGTKQTVAVWFDGARMYLLAIRDDFTRPRALTRWWSSARDQTRARRSGRRGHGARRSLVVHE